MEEGGGGLGLAYMYQINLVWTTEFWKCAIFKRFSGFILLWLFIMCYMYHLLPRT